MRPFIQRQNTRFRDCVPAEKVLAIGLYRIAHGGSYINTGLAMNVGKGTVYEAFYDVINGLYELRFDYIKLPETMAETRASIETFTHLSDLPNIAGAVDGSHIRIKAPKDSPADYFRKYHQYDVIIQAGDEWDDDELEDNDPDNRDNNNDILADGDAIRELLKDYL
ncbi:hypothetical protein AC249_AIPGENE11210 [Exaiptasia diaphana]|nr:hypothetical protein AC249_AIPGENE11210 [Exaiptasia diaphana]